MLGGGGQSNNKNNNKSEVKNQSTGSAKSLEESWGAHEFLNN